jgi:hypothetical protein
VLTGILIQSGVAVIVGVISAFVTAFLVPRRQHWFWLRQRRFEERMRNLTELHKLSARLFEYLGPDWATGELTGGDSRERNTEIEDALAREWHAVADQTEFLFGAPAYQKLQSFMAKFPRVLFRRLPDHPEKAVDVWDDFVRARHVAFESLYADLFTNK